MTCHENLKQFFRIFANIACFVMLVRGTKRPVACYWQRGVLPARALVHVANGGGVGLLTGHPSYIIVIDADRNAERLFKYPKLAQSCRVTRPNAPDRIKILIRIAGPIPCSQRVPAAGLELLSTGAQAAIAGQHPSGAYYQLSDAPIIEMTFDELAEIWFELTGKQLIAYGLRQLSRSHDTLSDDSTAHLLRSAIETTLSWGGSGPAFRNDRAFLLSRQLRDKGLSQFEATPILLQYQIAVQYAGDHEFTAREVLATLNSAFKHKRLQSVVDATLDGIELAVSTGRERLSVNRQKTLFAIITLMRKCGKIDEVSLSLRQIAELNNLSRPTVRNHIRELIDRHSLLVLVRPGDSIRASEYSLSEKARHIARVEHPPQGGPPLPGGGQLWHDDDERGIRASVATFHELQAHPLSAPGARIDPRLADDETEASAIFGPSTQAILAAFAGFSSLTVATIVELAHVSIRTVYRRMESLVSTGLVQKSGVVFTISPNWRELANEFAPALTTFGRLDLRAWTMAKAAAHHHTKIGRFARSVARSIAEHAADRARQDEVFWEAQVAERQRERIDFGLRLGLLKEDIPPISLVSGRIRTKIQQPWKAARAGRKVVPDSGSVHLGKGSESRRERIDRLLSKRFLLAPEADELRRLASELGVSVECELVHLNV